jgi:hypothetical protein
MRLPVPELPEFQKKQYAFAAHIRDPQNVPAPPGIEDRRMAVYRQLFFNNVRSLLGNMFPVLRELLGDEKWSVLIRQFMQKHRAETPYFLQMPREFIGFLQNGFEPSDDDFPFLDELAHYEYIELALSIAEETDAPNRVDPDGDLLNSVPVKSPLAWVYAYQYPVHRISKEFIPSEPAEQPVYLAVYRRPDDSVGFLELNPVTARLLESIEDNENCLSGEQLLRKLAVEMDYADVDALIKHGAAALREMRQLDVLIGARDSR